MLPTLLLVALLATRRQIVRDPPQAVRHSFHYPSPTQRFQLPHVGGHDLFSVGG